MLPLLYLIWIVLFNVYVDNVHAKRRGKDYKSLPKYGFAQQMEEKTPPQMYYYDDFGNLIVNGSVPGKSKPIVLDYKTYTKKFFDYYTSNVYFFFTFTVRTGMEALWNTKDECPGGMIICYEGQLSGDNVLEEFWVPNLSEYEAEHSWVIGQKCKEANSDVPTLHGLQIVVKKAPVNISNENRTVRVFEITSSILKDKYLYVVPENGKMVLQIGGRHNMDTQVTDVNNNPLTRAYANGSGDANHGAAPDVNQLKWFREHRGLWLLYPDFKRSPREMQVMSTIHSENCNMILHIRGNRMQKCRSFFEDIAVTEPVNTTLEMLYTYEIGSVRKQEQSFEQAAEQRRQKGREKLRRKETKRGTETKYDTMYTNETQDEEERKSAQLKESNAKMYGKMNGEYDADGATWKSILPGAAGLFQFAEAKIEKFLGAAVEKTKEEGKLQEQAGDQVKNIFDRKVREVFVDKIGELMENISKNLLNNQTRDLLLGQVNELVGIIIENMSSDRKDNSLLRETGNVYGRILDALDTAKIGEITVRKLRQQIKGLDKTVTGKQLKQLIDLQLNTVSDGIEQDLNKIQELIQHTISSLEGKLSDRLTTKIKDLLRQQLQNLLKKVLPKLLSDKIQGRIKTELQKLIEIITPFFADNKIQQHFDKKLRSLVKSVFGKKTTKGHDKELDKLIVQEKLKLSNKIKMFLNGKMQKLISQLTTKFSAEEMEKLLIAKANEESNEIEKLIDGSNVGELENKAKEYIKRRLNDFLQNIPVELLSEDGEEQLKYWFRDQIRQLIDEMLTKVKLNEVREWLSKELKNTIEHNIATLDTAITHLLKLLQKYPSSGSQIEERDAFWMSTKDSIINLVKDKLLELVKLNIHEFMANIFPDLFGHIIEKLKAKLEEEDAEKIFDELMLEKLLKGKLKELLNEKTQKLVEKSLDNIKEKSKVNLDGSWKKTTREETTSENSTSKSTKDSKRAFGGLTKQNSLMESFKSTKTFANTMSTSTFVQSSTAFTSKEIVDIKVSNLPPNKKVVITQLMFECDGNIIRLPQLYFHDECTIEIHCCRNH